MRLALAALVTSACWTTKPAVEDPDRTPPSFTVDRAGDASWQRARLEGASYRRPGAIPRHSEWEGTYRCNQGLTAVHLTIDVGPGGDARATYEFGAVPSNPTVPSGSFLLRGAMSGNSEHFEGVFDAAEWIVHPPKYFMVGVTVETAEDARTMTGTIQHASCSDFRVKRVD